MILETPQERFVPTIDEALRSPVISHWLKNALRSALDRDPVQAANEAQLLFDILDTHACEVVERSIRLSQIPQTVKP